MKQHEWITEWVSGGPAGGDDVYYCTRCGCCGGGTEGNHFTGSIKDGTFKISGPFKLKPRPFIPGPAYNISYDCDEAMNQIGIWNVAISMDGYPGDLDY